MDISVVIVAWNNCSELQSCLQSLASQSSKDFEIVLIDNHSSDGTVDMVRTEFPEIILKIMNSNLGFAEGCNQGIEIANGDWICILNSDTIAKSNWIAEIRIAIRDADNELGMLQSKVLFKKNPEKLNSTGVLLLATGSSGDRGFQSVDEEDQVVEEIFVPSACAAVYRKEMLWNARLESGFFDRTFFMYSEDLDLGWRCRLLGWKALYIPKATVLHSYQGSSKKKGKHFADLQCRKNRIRTLLKNASLPFLVIAVPKTIYDLILGYRYIGFKVFAEFLFAFRDGQKQRKSVTELLKIPRREVEKKWVTLAIRIDSDHY